MVRVGGLQYTIDPAETAGKRITDMRLNGKAIEANKTYKVAGWAPVSEEAKNAGGEAIWDVIERHLRDVKVVKAVKLNEPIIKGVKGNPGMAPI
jgi:sulfur-oxidizing protein SoxB